MRKRLSQDNGFTLVELAIVLVIVGILIAGSMLAMRVLFDQIKLRETRETISAAMESINSYAATNNRLPVDFNSFQAEVKNYKDAWNRSLIYISDSNLAPSSPTKDSICGRRSTNISITDSSTGATINNIAYLVLSQLDPATTDTRINATPVTSGLIASATVISANTVEDVVRWVTLDELRTKIGCQGSQLKITNNELPYGSKSSVYNATVYADGGVPFSSGGSYKWCLKGTLPTGVTITPATGACAASASCSALGAESEWSQSTSLVLGGTPTVDGSYTVTILVRDNNDNDTSKNIDNCVAKPFVITVNPQ